MKRKEKETRNVNALRDLMAFGPDWKEKEFLMMDTFYSEKIAEAEKERADTLGKIAQLQEPLAKEGLRSKESIRNARQSKVNSGNEFREKLREAVKYMKKKYPKKSKSERWIANELHKKAIEWKNQDQMKREESWNDDNPIMQFNEIVNQKPRQKATILKAIYNLKNSPT